MSQIIITAFLGLHSYDYWFFGAFIVVLLLGLVIAAYLEP